LGSSKEDLVEKHMSNKDELPPQKLELKELPSNLKYAFLDDSGNFPVIIAANLDQREEQDCLRS
jgi:hypothetical protein